MERFGYRPKEAAVLIGVSERWLRELIRRGQIRVVMTGRRQIVPRTALLEFLNEKPTEERDEAITGISR